MTGGGEAFGSGARRDRDDEPATAMACDDGQSCKVPQPLRARQAKRCGRDGNRAKDTEDTTSRGARVEMSLGFALAPFPHASAVAYRLEYAAALESTA